MEVNDLKYLDKLEIQKAKDQRELQNIELFERRVRDEQLQKEKRHLFFIQKREDAYASREKLNEQVERYNEKLSLF